MKAFLIEKEAFSDLMSYNLSKKFFSIEKSDERELKIYNPTNRNFSFGEILNRVLNGEKITIFYRSETQDIYKITP